MESQVYEWLPWLDGELESVPSDSEMRQQWLRDRWHNYFSRPALAAQEVLAKWYGATPAAKVRYAELFEISEYGHQPDETEIRQLFPFLPDNDGSQ